MWPLPALRPGQIAVVGVGSCVRQSGADAPIRSSDGPVAATRAPPGPNRSGQSGSCVLRHHPWSCSRLLPLRTRDGGGGGREGVVICLVRWSSSPPYQQHLVLVAWRTGSQLRPLKSEGYPAQQAGLCIRTLSLSLSLSLSPLSGRPVRHTSTVGLWWPRRLSQEMWLHGRFVCGQGGRLPARSVAVLGQPSSIRPELTGIALAIVVCPIEEDLTILTA